MKNYSIVFIALLICSNVFANTNTNLQENIASGALNTFLADADKFFKSNVKNGAVAYAAINSDKSKLIALTKKIKDMSLTGLSKNEVKAFYINSYNVLVIKGIIDNYPIKKPTNKAGFFDKIKYPVAGQLLTLNDIENKKIRPVYNDPRIHFALVCAAKGCPKIQPYAYMPATLDKQLDTVTKASMNSTYFTRVDSESKASVSQIFEWYMVDFGGNKKGVVSFINKYRRDKLSPNAKISFYAYDWTLNAQ